MAAGESRFLLPPPQGEEDAGCAKRGRKRRRRRTLSAIKICAGGEKRTKMIEREERLYLWANKKENSEERQGERKSQ